MGISPSTYWQAKADPAATAETSPPDIIFTAPYFLPAPSNVLLIDSFSTMSGTSLGSALLYSPHGGGVAMSKSGRLRSVPADRWAAMERYVRRARECSEQLRQSSWSRPQVASCPTTVYFDLGPAEEGGELYGLSRTGHQVFEEDLFVMNGRTVPIIKRTEIRASTKMPDGSYVETMLEEMPEPITELENTFRKLVQELFSASPTDAVPTLEEGEQQRQLAEAMVAALASLSSAVKISRWMTESYRSRSRKQQGNWFNW